MMKNVYPINLGGKEMNAILYLSNGSQERIRVEPRQGFTEREICRGIMQGFNRMLLSVKVEKVKLLGN